MVAMFSGWASKLGTDAFTGRDASNVYHFPGFGEDAIDVLLERGARRRSGSTR